MILGFSGLSPLEIGGGRVQKTPELSSGTDPLRSGALSAMEHRALLHLSPTKGYADAQLDDTRFLERNSFRWRPPLRFSVRARVSPPAPRGTFGFGFWNDPFSVSTGMGGAARKLPSAPQCAWFFYGSPPLDLPLAEGVPGSGWKAATLRFRQIPSLLLAPVAIGGALLAALPPARRWAFRQARRFYRAAESPLAADPSLWHAYAIEWLPEAVRLFVDDEPVLRSVHPPAGPLGLVAWIDNQYAVASPEKGFGFGVLPLDAQQFLELAELRLESPLSA
jgi:hypothetical protein